WQLSKQPVGGGLLFDHRFVQTAHRVTNAAKIWAVTLYQLFTHFAHATGVDDGSPLRMIDGALDALFVDETGRELDALDDESGKK
uniref:Uncharacterized protein n=1 Tax=Romanomermis culicivorax TaxID=13658 RepID=A0A915KX32_ROMCU